MQTHTHSHRLAIAVVLLIYCFTFVLGNRREINHQPHFPENSPHCNCSRSYCSKLIDHHPELSTDKFWRRSRRRRGWRVLEKFTHFSLIFIGKAVCLLPHQVSFVSDEIAASFHRCWWGWSPQMDLVICFWKLFPGENLYRTTKTNDTHNYWQTKIRSNNCNEHIRKSIQRQGTDCKFHSFKMEYGNYSDTKNSGEFSNFTNNFPYYC